MGKTNIEEILERRDFLLENIPKWKENRVATIEDLAKLKYLLQHLLENNDSLEEQLKIVGEIAKRENLLEEIDSLIQSYESDFQQIESLRAQGRLTTPPTQESTSIHLQASSGQTAEEEQTPHPAVEKPRKSKRGPRRYTEDEQIRLVQDWENINRDQYATKLIDFLCERTGTNPDGSPCVAESTFYVWRKRIMKAKNS